MPLIGTRMPNYTLLCTFQTSDIEFLSPQSETLSKTPKRDHIYKLCLYTLEEHNCLILTS